MARIRNPAKGTQGPGLAAIFDARTANRHTWRRPAPSPLALTHESIIEALS